MKLNPTSSLQLDTTKTKVQIVATFYRTEQKVDYIIPCLFNKNGCFPCNKRKEKVGKQNKENAP